MLFLVFSSHFNNSSSVNNSFIQRLLLLWYCAMNKWVDKHIWQIKLAMCNEKKKTISHLTRFVPQSSALFCYCWWLYRRHPSKQGEKVRWNRREILHFSTAQMSSFIYKCISHFQMTTKFHAITFMSVSRIESLNYTHTYAHTHSHKNVGNDDREKEIATPKLAYHAVRTGRMVTNQAQFEY